MESVERKQRKQRKHEGDDTSARRKKLTKEHDNSHEEEDILLKKRKKKKESAEEISTPIDGSTNKKKSKRHEGDIPVIREKLTKEHAISQEEEDTPMKKKKKKKQQQRGIEESSTPIKEMSTPINDSSAKKKGKAQRLKKEKSSEIIAVNKEKEEKKKKKRKKRLKESLDSTFSGKRRRLGEDSHSDAGVHGKRSDVLFRLLVPSKVLGKVIGQHGSRVQELREKTGAHIKIGDAIMNFDERVIWISSKEEDLESQSAAERALLHVVTLLVKPENEEQEIVKIRLLIAGSQAGGVIGKAAVAIDELRQNTGAIVQVLTKDKFPLLAFASETDRLVQLEGKVSQVLKALELIAATLRRIPSYSGSVKGRKGLMVKNNGAIKASVQIKIPNDLSRNVIGKEGTNIRQIRRQCGAISIEVDKLNDDAQDTTIHLKGTLAKVTMAQTLLQVFLASKQRTG